MVLFADEVPLNINSKENPSVISVVNNPKYESAYSPIIAMIMHTVIKQMSVRNQESSFILMEEAPHQQNGKRIVRGMPKEGSQSHIHIVVSRKDMSNKYSLSPGSN